MNWTRQEHPKQLEMAPKLEAPLSNAERQKLHRQRMKKLGFKQMQLFVTEDEKHFIQRTLEAIRKHDGVPAMVRDAKGQMKVIDI